MFNLKGKKIIITGASRGLGLVCAKAFAQEGARLVLIARSSQDLENVKNSCLNHELHLCISLDLTNLELLREGIKQAKEFLGEVDIILHVAGGGLGLREPIISAENMDKLLNLNLKSAVEINHLLLPDMIQKKKGNIVHVCSIASSEAVASVGYNTAKAALAAYVRSLGREIASSGVIITGILPGGFLAPGNSMERLQNNKPEIYQQFIKDRLPRGFMGKAEEIVPLILFLCSEQASMMNSCLVPIDAGEGTYYSN